MLRKICLICGKASYSASERGPWPCPYCDTDLEKERIMDIIDIEPSQDEEQSTSMLPRQKGSSREKT